MTSRLTAAAMIFAVLATASIAWAAGSDRRDGAAVQKRLPTVVVEVRRTAPVR